MGDRAWCAGRQGAEFPGDFGPRAHGGASCGPAPDSALHQPQPYKNAGLTPAAEPPTGFPPRVTCQAAIPGSDGIPGRDGAGVFHSIPGRDITTTTTNPNQPTITTTNPNQPTNQEGTEGGARGGARDGARDGGGDELGRWWQDVGVMSQSPLLWKVVGSGTFVERARRPGSRQVPASGKLSECWLGSDGWRCRVSSLTQWNGWTKPSAFAASAGGPLRVEAKRLCKGVAPRLFQGHIFCRSQRTEALRPWSLSGLPTERRAAKSGCGSAA